MMRGVDPVKTDVRAAEQTLSLGIFDFIILNTSRRYLGTAALNSLCYLLFEILVNGQISNRSFTECCVQVLRTGFSCIQTPIPSGKIGGRLYTG